MQSGGTRDRGINIVSVPTKSGWLATMHLIVDAVVVTKTYSVPLPGSSDDTECEDTEAEVVMEENARNADLDEISVLYEYLMQGSMSADQVCQSDVMNRIHDALEREA